jgi:hypothetical protein
MLHAGATGRCILPNVWCASFEKHGWVLAMSGLFFVPVIPALSGIMAHLTVLFPMERAKSIPLLKTLILQEVLTSSTFELKTVLYSLRQFCLFFTNAASLNISKDFA